MNARQKAKKLKKENEHLKWCLNPHINPFPVYKERIHPEILKMKFMLEPFMPEDMMRNKITMSIGRSLMDNGFLDIKTKQNYTLNRTDCTVSLIAARWPVGEGG